MVSIQNSALGKGMNSFLQVMIKVTEKIAFYRFIVDNKLWRMKIRFQTHLDANGYRLY